MDLSSHIISCFSSTI